MHDPEQPAGGGPGPQQPDLRVSDRDRDHVVELLSEHAAHGRLTLTELEERAEQAYGAKTGAELAVLLRDPPDPTLPADRRRKARRWFVAVMSSSDRRGRFRLGRRAISIGIMGGHNIDLCNAEIDSDEVVIYSFALLGNPDIYVPDSVGVEMTGFTLIGGDDEQGSQRPPRPGAPVLRVRSYALLGGCTVWRLTPEMRGMSLPEARRAARALTRGSS